jgi:putative RecB family exonuclease
LAEPSPSASSVHLPVVPQSPTSVDPPAADEAAYAGYLSHAHLSRFAQCALSFQLHYVDRLPADIAPARHFGSVVHSALQEVVREHVRAGRTAPLDPELTAAAYRRAWTESELRDHAVFADGLALVKRWAAREGVVDPTQVLGVEVPFELSVGPVRVRGTLDRVDRIADDAIRVRDYKTTRQPPRRDDAEESLQLALYDLAARELWPWARRVEVALDLLRHDVVLRVERTDAQRDATRRYVLATAAQIARGDYPPRPSTLCATCDHRAQCSTYADARAGKRVHVGAEPGDLPAVAREREELAVLLKASGERKDELDAILRTELEHARELELEGRRYTIVTALRRDYALGAVLAALSEAGVDNLQAIERLGRTDSAELRALVDELGRTLPSDKLGSLKAALDAHVQISPSTRLTVREVRS